MNTPSKLSTQKLHSFCHGAVCRWRNNPLAILVLSSFWLVITQCSRIWLLSWRRAGVAALWDMVQPTQCVVVLNQAANDWRNRTALGSWEFAAASHSHGAIALLMFLLPGQLHICRAILS